MRDPRKILAGAARTLDFDRPVGLVLLGIMGQLSDGEGPEHIGRFLQGLRLVERGLVRSADWHPDPDSADVTHEQGHAVGAVGLKE